MSAIATAIRPLWQEVPRELCGSLVAHNHGLGAELDSLVWAGRLR